MNPSEQAASVLRRSAELKIWAADHLAGDIASAADRVVTCLRADHKVLFAGNGGSAADAQHIATEFTGRFMRERPGLPAIALTTDTSALTAIANDYGYDDVFRRQVEALGRPGDVLVLITTSGRSANLLTAARFARERGITTIGLLGRTGGPLAELVDLPIIVRSDDGQRIQECHITIGHAMCEIVESALYDGSAGDGK